MLILQFLLELAGVLPEPIIALSSNILGQFHRAFPMYELKYGGAEVVAPEEILTVTMVVEVVVEFMPENTHMLLRVELQFCIFK